MIWSKADWRSNKTNKKRFKVEWQREVIEECVGYVEAENKDEALKEFEAGHIIDEDVIHEYVSGEEILAIGEEDED